MKRLKRFGAAFVLSTVMATGMATLFSTPVQASDGQITVASICAFIERLEAAVATLPEELRAAYGPAFAPHHQPFYGVGGALARALLPRLPRRLRDDPIAAIAIERAAQMGRLREGAGRGGEARVLQPGASSQGYRDGLLRRGGPAIHGDQALHVSLLSMQELLERARMRLQAVAAPTTSVGGDGAVIVALHL